MHCQVILSCHFRLFDDIGDGFISVERFRVSIYCLLFTVYSGLLVEKVKVLLIVVTFSKF